MKDAIANWLAGIEQPSTALALAVRLPDRTLVSRHLEKEFTPAAVEQALRCVAETFQVLTLHRSTSQRVTLHFEKSRVFAASRADGACLGLFLPISDVAYTSSQFATLASEFSRTAVRR